MNPHVKWNAPTTTDSLSQDKLRYAIAYADNAKAAYKNALSSQAELSSWLGIGLIPLAAAAAGLGVTGGPPAAIAAVGLTGAAGYGIGTWLTSKPAQRAWVSGYNATSCAVDAVIPLLDIEDDKAFKSDIDAIGPKITPVQGDIGRLNQWRGRKDESLQPLLPQADAARMAAEQLVATARSATAKANELRVDAQTAGRRLKEAVDRISGQVSSAIVETGPDLQALSSIISGLGRSYGQFTQTADSIKPTPASQKVKDNVAQGASDDPTRLSKDIADLAHDTEELAQAVDKVANRVNAIAAKKPVETLKACGVSADQLAVPLSIDPPGTIEIQQGTAATVGRVIKGGASPYAVTLPGAAVEGLSVRQTDPFGPAFVIQTTDKTPATTTTIHATDRSGNHTFVNMKVQEASAQRSLRGTDQPPSLAGTLSELASAVQGLSFLSGNVMVGYTKVTPRGDKNLSVDVTITPSGENVADDVIKNDLVSRGKPDLLKDVTVQIRRVTSAATPPAGALDQTLTKFASVIKGKEYPLPNKAGTVKVDTADVKGQKLHITVTVSGTTTPLTQKDVDALGDAIKNALPFKNSGLKATDIVVDKKVAAAGGK